MRAAARHCLALPEHAWNSARPWQVEVETTSRGIITTSVTEAALHFFVDSALHLNHVESLLLWSSRAPACALRRLLAGHRLVAGFPAATLACHHARGLRLALLLLPLLRLRRLQVTSGARYCQVTNGGNCVTDGRLLWQLRACAIRATATSASAPRTFNRELLRQNPDR